MNHTKNYDKEFARRFWRGALMCIAAAFVIAISLVIIGMANYYGQKFNW